MKKVLFICRDNSCRSQIATAFARRFGEGVIEACSAGPQPASDLDPMAGAVLKERGFDPHGLRPAGLDPLRRETFDLIVQFGCSASGLPAGPGGVETRDWGDIPDPQGKAYAEYRRVRELVGNRVLELIRECRGHR